MFAQMSFGEAVSYVHEIGTLMNLLWLSIPIVAALAIRRGKRNRPSSRLVFARCVLWGWMAILIGSIAYFFIFSWYSEQGPPPQTFAAQITVAFWILLAVTLAIHIGLFRTTRVTQQ
jgi:hypothetical protein